ncbi:RNA polymerase I-specific transcription initiation factor RRN3 [Copidosoma floridanum]|uniref:RNA polymerase I-specific transcription initiation factor RRN3 n=1 Tax=Copidosoma floridanum TaxID=29053 RepID=UPI0006C9DF3F|nr:RNA polymerase I-specific transcription initiation factor RRN3 [Copidosoma floridanum]XP_014208370.1 RNA polymerase I-specific transcription initiation factor RRN3 [Copidosoma floridanum]
MSVVSTPYSSVSSILKSSGARTSLIRAQKKISFKLPKNLKVILTNYENGCNRQEYQDTICIIRDTNIKEYDLLEFLSSLQECVSMLGKNHKFLIEAMLKINWISRSSEVIASYKKFIEDLMCIHIYHSKLIFDNLVNQFKLTEDGDTKWCEGKCPEKYLTKSNHVHDLLKKFLRIIPMSIEIFLQTLEFHYPRTNEGILVAEQYQFSLIQILSYAPQLRKEILGLIIRKLTTLDVTIPPSEILAYDENTDDDYDDDEEMFDMDDANDKNNSKAFKDTELKHPDAEILDVCMEQIFSYVYDCCHVDGQLQIESIKSIYNDLLHNFERIIFTTQSSHHVQFIMFYLCSFKTLVAETFIRRLWQAVSSPSVITPVRQTSVAYIASLLARATYLRINLIQGVLSEIVSWVHSYISSQDSVESADPTAHALFYSMCHAIFYLIAFRHKDLTEGKKNLLFLQELNITKIVTSRLNPLKFCQPAVVQNFAAVTRKYQIAYCYTVIDRNSRSNLPVLYNTNCTVTALETFFPFDPYLLPLSGRRIAPIYNSSANAMNSNATDSNAAKDKSCDENDFMDDSFLSCSPEPKNHIDKFSYSTSPGFMYT